MSRLIVSLVIAVGTGTSLGIQSSPASAQLQTGELFVVSDPPGARVVIDGNELEDTTPFGPAQIPIGDHSVELRHPDFAVQRRHFMISTGLTTKISVSFVAPPIPLPVPTPPPVPSPGVVPPAPPAAVSPLARETVGAVRIESEPLGATVFLAGAPRGQTPLELSALKQGTYDFRLELPGYVTHAGTIDVKPGETVVAITRLAAAFSPGGGGPSVARSRAPSAVLALVFAVLVITGTGTAALIVIAKRRRTLAIQRTPPRGVPVEEALTFGDYQVVEKIATGGMANIYKAIHKTRRDWAVLKVPYEQFQHDKTFIERFRREGDLGRKLHNENIVKIHEAGTTRDGVTYIAMEYIDGIDLRRLMATTLSIPTIIDIIVQVCRALDYAHSKQILHRDIKPENVMVAGTQSRRVVLMDFGIARAGFLGTLSTGSTYLGTPYYMAPEPANGRQPGPFSDLYSVGVVLFELLTGRRPFDADNPVAVLQHHVATPPPSPRNLNPRVPVELESILLRLLAKLPEARYQAADEVIVDLQNFARQYTTG